MILPSDATAHWLLLLFAVTWPGLLSVAVYRTRVPGPRLVWRDAFAVGAFFTALDYIVFLPAARLITGGPENSGLVLYWASCVLLLLVGPALLPIAWSWVRNQPWMSRRFVAQYDTAWDYYFLKREPAFVLIHLKGGSFIGGYWGPGSYASLSPNAGDLYLTTVYEVDSNGRLGEAVKMSDGLLVRRDEYSHIELYKPPAEETA